MNSLRQPIIAPNPTVEAETTTRTPEKVSSPVDTGVEVPYTDDAKFLGDYFKLGDLGSYNGVYAKELESIDQFVQDKINSGDVANSKKAVLSLLKGLEKMNNLKDEERSSVRLGVLANYAEFLSRNKDVRQNVIKYG